MAGISEIRTEIRPFNGTLTDAQGLLAVEQTTFNESPYSPEQIRDMLADGTHRAWLALAGETIAGFVVSFPTWGFRGSRWEVDLLAVEPNFTGRGLGGQLIRATAADGEAVASRARAVVADDNIASLQAFTRSGFHLLPEACHLVIYRTRGLAPRPWSGRGVSIREATGIEAVDWLKSAFNEHCGHAQFRSLDQLPHMAGAPEHGLGDSSSASSELALTVLLAEQDGQPAGYAELIPVQTLLYRGVWIESLAAWTQPARAALVHEAVNRAKRAGLDEIGAMVPMSDWFQQKALLAAGFRSLGTFRWLVADLPLFKPSASAASALV
jgi:ribosomal protein S18 acetylase RimI-like enzyme